MEFTLYPQKAREMGLGSFPEVTLLDAFISQLGTLLSFI